MTEPVSYSHLFPDLAEREEAARLLEAKKAARLELADHPLNPMTDYEGGAVRCEASGIPIMVDDEYVEDGVTGEIWLRAVIGLGPRAVVDDEMADESDLEPENA